MIRLVQRKDIDTHLWNKVIKQAENGVIYALSYFLDHANYSWGAAIEFDHSMENPYKSVMPFFVGKKYGFKYVAYEPWYTMLGIFSQKNLDESQVSNMINMVRKNHIKINKYPFEPVISERLKHRVDSKFISDQSLNYFDLSANYHQLKSRYNRNRVRSIKIAKVNDLRFIETGNIDLHIRLFRESTLPKISGMRPSQLDQLVNIYAELEKQGMSKIYEVKKGEETLSSGMFLFFNRTITYYTTTNTNSGNSANAQSYLIDSIFQNYAGSHWVLEAYSGTHKGVSRFYESFGAEEKIVKVWQDQRLLVQNIFRR